MGDGRFMEATEAHGLSDPARAYGFGVVATDYDDDGFVDLFVANDSNPNFLYRNLGNGRFESVGLVAGVAVNGEAGPRRGWAPTPATTTATPAWTSCSRRSPTIATRSIATSTAASSRTRRVAAGLAAPTFVRMGWGTAFLDADLDGRLDLFFANGHIFADIDALPAARRDVPSEEPAPAAIVGTRFRDVSARAGGGLQVARVGRGLAVGDLDDDGDPDLVVSNMDDAPTLLENRQRTGHHWVGVPRRVARRATDSRSAPR